MVGVAVFDRNLVSVAVVDGATTATFTNGNTMDEDFAYSHNWGEWVQHAGMMS